jgi:hypothetical protein
MNARQLPCVVCGKELHETAGQILQCTYCGRGEKSDFSCEPSHYVCEPCRTATAADVVRRTCANHRSGDYLSLANLLMRHPAVPAYGPEHHLVVPAVLLTVAHVSGHAGSLDSMLNQSARRVARFTLGSCASTGVCGAAAGVPIAVSLLIEADYTKATERATVLRASSSAVAAIASLPGSRCCKASVYSSLNVGITFLRQDMGLKVSPALSPICQFSEVVDGCYRDLCPFFGGGRPDSFEGSGQ